MWVAEYLQAFWRTKRVLHDDVAHRLELEHHVQCSA